MRIIERGTPPEQRLIVKTCSNCSTIFEFCIVEATKHYDQRDGDAFIIDCPVCKKEIWFT